MSHEFKIKMCMDKSLMMNTAAIFH